MISDSIRKEWQETIGNMSYEELQRTLEDSCYYQEYKELVKKRMVELEERKAQVQEMFIKALKKKRWRYELVNDGNRVIFTKKNKNFFADFGYDEDSIFVYSLHKIYINMEDETKLSVLRKAINATNIICSVTTYYDKDKDGDNIIVLSKGIINFVIDNPNFEVELAIILEDCLAAQYVVKEYMKKKTIHTTKQGFHVIVP